jgi:hypothetical protein
MSDPSQRKKGLKINNQASTVPVPQNNNPDAFEKQAQEVFDKSLDYKQQAFELGTRFKVLMLDKILPENKTTLAKDLEKEVVQKLAALATEMNTDENLTEGDGNVAVSILLMRMLLIQRDIINEISFKLEKTGQTLSKILLEKQSQTK